MKMYLQTAAITVIAAILSACGGGASSSDKASASSTGSSSSSSSSGSTITEGAYLPGAGQKVYRLYRVDSYDEDLNLIERETRYYNANHNPESLKIETFYGDDIFGQLALEIDFTYDSVDPWQTSVVTMKLYDSWQENSAGGLISQTVWEDTWSDDKLVSNIETITGYTETGDFLWDASNEATREYDGDYNTVFQVGPLGVNAVNWIEDRIWSNNGQLTTVFGYQGEYYELSQIQEYEYGAQGLIYQYSNFEQVGTGTEKLTVSIYDFSDPSEVVMGWASGTSEDDVEVRSKILHYRERPCGRSILAKSKYETEPTPICFIQ